MIDHPVGCGTYAFLCKQRQALIRDFNKSDACFVAISPEELEWMQQCESWTVEYLSNCHKDNAFVVRKSSAYDPECWVRWDYTGYRKAFANSRTAVLSRVSCGAERSLSFNTVLCGVHRLTNYAIGVYFSHGIY